jgi:ATP-dependent helicase/nuclease subunit B
METFLSELASELLSRHRNHLADICVVMPNRRAGLFLKKNLREKASGTILAPDIFSIEDFLTHLTGLKVADNTRLLFVLFDIHTTLEGDKAQPLEEFMKTAQKMLADFNDIDKYLAEPQKLFGFLNEAKAIERWNPDGTPLTPTELDYLRFYQRLLDYYTSLNRQLNSLGEAYQGMIYRRAAGQIESYSTGMPWVKIYFAGFNALTPAEEHVIGHLRESGKAEMIRDVDDYYISGTEQEAGYFFRKQLAREGAEKFGKIGFHLRNDAKKIHLHGTPGISGQVALAAGLLNDILNNRTVERNDAGALHTALVPADEQLLIPLLNALPENPGKVNVSMGYPLKLTPAYTFILTIFRLYENAERLRSAGDEKHFRFYFRDIVALLKQPFVAATTNVEGLLKAVTRSKQVFYSGEELQWIWKKQEHTGTAGLLEIMLINHQPGALGLLQILEDAVRLIRDFYNASEQASKTATHHRIQQEYLYLTATLLQRIRELNARFDSIQSIRALREIFVLLAKVSNLPFSGEPLEGIQIMGMLETRNLDFESVILVAANEGILPGDGKSNSFIPYDIRADFNLPNHNHHNAVAAYHFYHLLQRAKEIHIIYNTEATQLGGGERSRFVQQLVTEYLHYNPAASIRELVQTPDVPDKSGQRAISVAKNERVFERLQEKAIAGFSPTSLNIFRRCSLQFYFQNIAGVKPADEMEETIEHRTIGSIVHRVLEKLYMPYLNAYITPQIIDVMKQKAGNTLSDAFEELYSGGQIKFGRNRLLYEVINNFIFAFLDFEKAFLGRNEASGNRLRILGLEKSIEPKEGIFSLPELPDIKINFRGSIDRVDELNDTIRIIDYKTGRINSPSDLRIVDWKDFADGSKKDKPFQVLMYAWLYKKQIMNGPQPLTGGVISLRNLSNGLMSFGIKSQGKSAVDEQIDDLKLEAFEEYLGTLFHRMFDRNEPFSQTDNLKVCEYCDFRSICNR